MRGVAPIVTVILILVATLFLISVLATFVFGFANDRMAVADMCIGGSLIYTSQDYPAIDGGVIMAVVEAVGADLSGFTIEAIDSDGTVWSRNVDANITAGFAGAVSADFSGASFGARSKARVLAINCPSARTRWESLR